MAQAKILVEGYTNTGDPKVEEKSCATISLVKDGNLNIVVDPGVMKNQSQLIDALAKENLTVDDIDIVCITHSHIDHYRNAGMFPDKTKIVEFWGLWERDIVKDWDEQLTKNIKIIKTPGHSYDGITLLVKTEKGIVAVCGDVFWKENFPENDSYATEPEKLEESRKKVLEMADWVIPGHGGIFKAQK